jgi:mannose-1-phosphate guanylyltransferase/mannose-6-phosphate isomerase
VNGLATSDIDLGDTLVVTNEEHRFLALDQLREMNDVAATLLLAPVGRNIAPALTIAALQAIENGNDPVLVVTPADQTVVDGVAFSEALQKSIRVADTGTIVILGITPTKPETCYGYIQRTRTIGSFGEYTVAQFAEKPDSESAQCYLASGDYSWNGGMFVLKASVWLKALKQFRLDIAQSCESAWVDKKADASFVRQISNYLQQFHLSLLTMQ